MATNKHAMIRYQALDRCFSNRYKRYYIEDLVEECNKAIYEFTGSLEGVKKRTIFSDISYMESPQGWNAPIKRVYEGKRCYYVYEEENFSINKKDLSEAELETIDEALVMLNRFKGMEGFTWIDEFIANFEDKLGKKNAGSPVIGYEQNPFLKGIDLLSPLFNYIVNKQALEIRYTPFKASQRTLFFHPYFLKQYNNRWFLLGVNDERPDRIMNLALDRIDDVKPADKTYIPNEDYDFSEYFDDVIGVSVPRYGEPMEVILRFDEDTYPYIESKPVHGSQARVQDMERTIRLKVFDTFELEQQILSHGEHVEILAPETFREKMKARIMKLTELYQ